MKKLFLFLVTLVTIMVCRAQSPLPEKIVFERMVEQQTNGEDGKANTTYYFTVNGDYAMAVHTEDGDDEVKTVLYTKEHQMCMINEKKKTIMVMNMPSSLKTISDTLKSKIKNKPLPKKENDDDHMTVTKTGKTKMICGYTSYEYLVKNDNGICHWWYAQVDFDPAKIYTMGVAGAGMSDKLQAKKEQLKNNPAAIPGLNKNYLMAEIEIGGKKGLETTTISKTSFTFSTAGYAIKDMKHLFKKE